MKSEETSESSDCMKVSNDCDLESETFSAKSSLDCSGEQVVIPVPEAHTFNNIDEYFNKSFGKTIASKHLPSVSGLKCEPIMKRTLKIEECVPKQKRRELPTILTKMKTSIRGPNSLLLKSINNRIKVLIRRRKSVELFNERFGWVSGLLVAFDKHHNLCMTDVDETYQTLDSNNSQINVCNHMRQLFVRGDNVVLISLV